MAFCHGEKNSPAFAQWTDDFKILENILFIAWKFSLSRGTWTSRRRRHQQIFGTFFTTCKIAIVEILWLQVTGNTFKILLSYVG